MSKQFERISVEIDGGERLEYNLQINSDAILMTECNGQALIAVNQVDIVCFGISKDFIVLEAQQRYNIYSADLAEIHEALQQIQFVDPPEPEQQDMQSCLAMPEGMFDWDSKLI